MKHWPAILVVDDSEENLIYLENVLKKTKVNLILALSGFEALEKSREIELALAIIDVNMPEMNGYELVLKMHEERMEVMVPVIFLTASHVNEIQVFKGYGTGAVDYLFKPIDNKILLSKVNVFLDLFNQKQTIATTAALLKKSADELTIANKALKKSEEKYRSYIDHAPDGVFVADEAGRYIEVNEAACRITGYSKDELLKMSVRDVLPEESLEDGLAHFRKVVQTGESKIEMLFKHKDGTKRWWTVESIKLSETRYLGFTKDVTLRKEMEEKIQISNAELEMQNDELALAVLTTKVVSEKYTELYDFAPTGYYTLSTDCKILELNHGGARLLGKDRSRLIDSRFAAFVSVDTLPVFHAFFQRIFTNDLKNICEVMLETADNKPKWVHIDGIVAADGTKCLINVVDITMRKHAEEEISRANILLNSIIENIPNMMFLKDANELRFVRYNKAGEDLLGIQREAFLGKNDYDFFPKEQADFFIENDRNVLQRKVVMDIQEEPIMTRHLGMRILHTKKVPILNTLGEPEYLLGISEDITERKQAEEELQKREERFRHISSTISDISYSCGSNQDGSYSIDWITGAAERITGYSIVEIKAAQCWGALVIDEDQDQFSQHVTGLAPGSTSTCELRIRHKNGGIVWVNSFAECISDQNQPGHSLLYGGLVNITERKLTEQALRESEELFRTVVYNSSDLTTLTTAEGIVTYCSPQCINVTGYPEDRFIGQTMPDIIHPSDVEVCRQAWEQVFNQGIELREFEYQIVDNEGMVRWLSHSAKVVKEGARIIGIQNTIRNITERKMAEQALKISEEKYKTMLSASPDGILLVDMKGIINEISEIGLELFGADSRDDMVGKDIFRFVPSDEKETVREIIEKTTNEGLVQNVGLKIRKKNQSVFAGETSATLIQGPDGAPVAFMIIIRDISRRKKMETKQIHADRMANLGEMASGIAHEINQPLNIISMVMDKILFESAKTETIDLEFLKNKSNKIFDNITRIRNIIDHIRAFSRSHDDFVLTAFDINSSIDNATSMILEQFKHLGISLDVQLDKQLPQIVGNTYKFEQVIVNLLVNAKDAVIEKKNKLEDYSEMIVRIRSYVENQMLIVEVADNGIGISNEDINNIILPFYTTKDEGKGTGIGLSICYQIIKEMDGTIEITSDRLHGTTVKLVLDIHKKK